MDPFTLVVIVGLVAFARGEPEVTASELEARVFSDLAEERRRRRG